MIHEIGVQLGLHLVARGWAGIPVIDGPEVRKPTTFARERVVIEHDPAGDEYASRHRADMNTRTRLTRNVGVKVTVYAQRANKGALYWEHVRRSEALLDAVQIGLDVAAKERGNLVNFRSSKLVYPDDLKDGETMGGAVYELFLTFDRGIADRMMDGSARRFQLSLRAAPAARTSQTQQSSLARPKTAAAQPKRFEDPQWPFSPLQITLCKIPQARTP